MKLALVFIAALCCTAAAVIPQPDSVEGLREKITFLEADMKAAERQAENRRNQLQEILRHYDELHPPAVPDPDPDPPPNPDPPAPDPTDSLVPLIVNGEQWTFRAQPPVGLKIRTEHPRLLLTRDQIPELVEKLDSGHYSKERKVLGSTPRYKALMYLLYNDEVAGEEAKAALLSIPADALVTGKSNFHWCLVYDWTWDLFTPAEREIAMHRILRVSGMNMPAPGETTIDVFDKHYNTPLDHDFRYKDQSGFYGWFLNNPWEPGTHEPGVLFRGIIALAFAHDGVRDEFCNHIFQVMLLNNDNRIVPIYDAVNGGLLSAHNIMALSTGGCQAGSYKNFPFSGYTSMFTGAIANLMACWESATGDNLFDRDNFFRKMPEWQVYSGGKRGSSMLMTCRLLTGRYTGDIAALAAWHNQQSGEGPYRSIAALVIGDKRIFAKSPSELGLPLSSYRRGADMFESRTSWDEVANTRASLTTREVDANRHELAAGLLGIRKRGIELLIQGQAKKGTKAEIFGSGIWIWKTGELPSGVQQGSTYRGSFHEVGTERTRRASSPYAVATKAGYKGATVVENHGGENYHVFAVDSARLRIHNKERIDVREARRTIVHLNPLDGREFVIVRDDLSLGTGLSHAWGGRFWNPVSVSGNRFTEVNSGVQMVGTVLLPADATLNPSGGPPDITIGPLNETQVDRRWFQAVAPDLKHDYNGSWSMYIQPQTNTTSEVYCVVLEIGDEGFVPTDAVLVGGAVEVGGWTVTFGNQTKVERAE